MTCNPGHRITGLHTFFNHAQFLAGSPTSAGYSLDYFHRTGAGISLRHVLPPGYELVRFNWGLEQWQRCVVHFYRNVLHAVPKGKAKSVALMLKAIHAQEDKAAARQKTTEVVVKLKSMRLEKAARIVESGCDETLSYYEFPVAHWRNIRTNNPLERLNREIRRRTRVVGSFPDGHAALMLVSARLRYMACQKWGTQRYMNMNQENNI